MMSREQSGAEQDRSMDLATLTAAERAGAAALAIQRMMGILHMGRASRVRVSCLKPHTLEPFPLHIKMHW